MAFPSVRSTITGEGTPDGTDFTVTMPATVENGDLLIAFVGSDGNSAYDFDSAAVIGTWTQLYATTATDSAYRFGCFAIIADGTEDSVTVNLNLSTSETAQWRIHAIKDWEGTLSGITVGTPNTATFGESADPPTVSASAAGDNLFIIHIGRDDSSNGSVIFTDTDFVDNVYSDVGSAGGMGCTGTATANLTGATEDPIAVTWTGAEQWVINTLVIEPAVSGGTNETVIVPTGPIR